MAIGQALREIEQKFTFNRHLLPILRGNGGTPPFRKLTPFKQTSFHDAYFDNPTRVLSKNTSGAIWLRKRDNNWQAKVAKSANKDFQQASYEEITRVPDIEMLIRKYLPDCPGAAENFGLSPYCQYLTNRTEFTANEKYVIALDTTDFGHDVGEVEVVAEAHEEDGKVMAEIGKFMEEYRWFFKSSTVKPKGKMTAYFEKYGGW